jgi:hypothetical protein
VQEDDMPLPKAKEGANRIIKDNRSEIGHQPRTHSIFICYKRNKHNNQF